MNCTRFPVTLLVATGLFMMNSGRTSAQCEIDRLIAATSTAGDAFGASLSLSGTTMIVGATFDDSGGVNTGSAYVFRRERSVWVEEQQLVPSDAASFDFIGFGVDIDGDVAVVGSPQDDDFGNLSGSAYVFRHADGVWTQEQKLLAWDGAPNDLMGRSVAVSGDRVAVGANDNEIAVNAGAVYVYRFDDGTGVWEPETKLIADDGGLSDLMGAAVVIEGNLILAGAPYEDEVEINAGAVYAFEEAGNGWVHSQKFTASDGSTEMRFGAELAIDGDWAVIGSCPFFTDPIDTGAAHVFYHDGEQWVEHQRLLPSGDALGERFGCSVAIAGDQIVVGTTRPYQNPPDTAAAYLFEYVEGVWTQVSRISGSTVLGGSSFGDSVGISEEWLMVGATEPSGGGASGSGSVYAFNPHAPQIVATGVGVSFDDQAFATYVDPRIESTNGVRFDLGLNRVTLVFSEPVHDIGGETLTAGAFAVEQIGAGTPPSVIDIETSDNQTVTVLFDGIISTQAWTTVTASVAGASGESGCDLHVGFLPGDVDQNRIVQPNDLLAYRQLVNGQLEPYRGTMIDFADIDRSGSTQPFDLLRFRQIINGIAPATQSWSGAALPDLAP